MATWGALGGAWQYAARAPGDERVNPRLFEAFGSDLGSFDTSGNGASGFGFGGPVRGPLRSGYDPNPSDLEEEVPRVFSMKGISGADFMASQLGSGLEASSGMRTGASATSSTMYGDPCWVTVFGFSGPSSTIVRQQIETMCGPIVEVRHGNGNYMHIRFSSDSAANRCLALNGRALQLPMGLASHRHLIGCVPCTESLTGGPGDTTAVGDESAMEAEMPFAARPFGPAFDPNENGFYGLKPAGSGEWNTARVGSFWLPWRRGPQVRRDGLLWRILDVLFDI